jgi:hypothetical protein
MRLGILADIHEDVPHLRAALDVLRTEKVDRVVLLGDVVDTARTLAEPVALLAGAGVVGVYGNHELGLCHRPDERTRRTYGGPILDFMQALGPRLQIEDCLFKHGLPHWDPTDPVVYYLGERPETAEGLAGTFAASPSTRVHFVGHFHRWLAATPRGPLPWDGSGPVRLQPPERYLVVIAAVCDGWCALYDTATGQLEPRRLGDS